MPQATAQLLSPSPSGTISLVSTSRKRVAAFSEDIGAAQQPDPANRESLASHRHHAIRGLRDLSRLRADLGINLVLWKKETANSSTCFLMLGTLIFAMQAMKRGEEFAARLNVIALSHASSPHPAAGCPS